MTRKEQILNASQDAAHLLSGTETLRQCFALGAEWADANPTNAETSDYYYIRKDKYDKLETELQEAKGVIKALLRAIQ